MTDESDSNKYPAPVKVAGISEAQLNFETAIFRRWGEVRLSAQDPVTKVVVWEMECKTEEPHPPTPYPLTGEGEEKATILHKAPYVTRGTSMSKLAAEVQGIRAYYEHRQEIEQPHMRGLGSLTPYYAFLATAEYNRPPSGVQDTQRINLLEENRILKKKIEAMQAQIDSDKKLAAGRLKARDYEEPSEDEKESRRDARRKKAEEMGMDAKDFGTMEIIEKLRGQYGRKGYGGRDSHQTLPVAALLTQDYVKERILASQSAAANEAIILEGAAKAVGE